MALHKNRDEYLGFFLTRPVADWVAVYNRVNDLGLARVFSRERVPGAKLFAWGPHVQERALYTAGDSAYMELWGGLPRTFFETDDFALAGGQVREWDA